VKLIGWRQRRKNLMAKGINAFKYNGVIGHLPEWVHKAMDKPRTQAGSLVQIPGSNELQLRNPDGGVSILHSGNYLVQLEDGQLIVAREDDLKRLEDELPDPFVEGETTQPAPASVVDGDTGAVADPHIRSAPRSHTNIPAPPAEGQKTPHSGMEM
jgi:hypothetical protein